MLRGTEKGVHCPVAIGCHQDHRSRGRLTDVGGGRGELDPRRAQVVDVEFADPQGKLEIVGKSSHYCNAGSTTVCVDEKSLFCLAKVCVEDVTMAAGAVTTKHTHTTDHMLIAVSDYELTDEMEGKGTVVRKLKSGEVEYIPAGITHRLTNTGHGPARFTVVLWR